MEYIDESKPIPVGFYGYGVRALDALMDSSDFTVKYFWTPESRIDQEVLQAARRYEDRLTMERIKNRRDLLEHVCNAGDAACFLMNASPIILNEAILERMDFYNIHPGNLAVNRGHHPHLWSVLLGEKETEITLHSVTAEIDLGKVIESVAVPVLEDDTAETLLNRAEDQIPCLLSALAEYLRGRRREKCVIAAGSYRRKMEYEDYRLIPERDTPADMSRKIRARSMHSGGFLLWEQKRYYVDRILENGKDDGRETEDGGISVTARDGILTLKQGGQRIRFHQSKVTDLEGNIIWRAER